MLENVLSQLVSTFATFSIAAILYCNYILFEAYATPILWSLITSQTLKPAKNKIIDFLNEISDTSTEERMLWRAVKKLKRGWFRRIRTLGTLGVFFDHSLVLFVLICAISMSLRLFTFRVVALTLLIVAAPAILSMYILDRNVFTYRHLISDDTLASVVVVCFFFFTVSFVFFSLTFEATAEFFQASQILIQRVTDSIEEDEVTREQWTGMVTSLQSAIETQIAEFRSIYNESAWFPFVDSSIQQIQLGIFNSTIRSNETVAVSSLQHANQQHDDHFEIPSFDMLYEQFNDMLQHKEVLLNAFHHAHTAVAVIALKPLLNFVSLASMALQFVFKSLVFFTLLMSLLAGKTDVLTKVFEMIPLSDTQRGLDALRESLEACFFLPFRIASSHAMIAIVTFHIFAADLPYVFEIENIFTHNHRLVLKPLHTQVPRNLDCVSVLAASDRAGKCYMYSLDDKSSSERTYHCGCVSVHHTAASLQSGRQLQLQ